MSKYLTRVTLIISIITCCIWTRWYGNWLVKDYEANVKAISALQTPVDIVNQYMYDEYNDYWLELDDVVRAGENDQFVGECVYDISTIKKADEEKYDLNYAINGSAKYGIGCETITGYPGTTIVSRYYYPQKIITRIYCSVSVRSETKGWVKEHFVIIYEDNQYYMCHDEGDEFRRLSEAEVNELEEKAGFTILEMVDIAYDAQAKLEELIYDVKEQAKVIEKRRLIGKLLFTCIPFICLVSAEVIFEIVMYRKRKTNC